jgi:hypothetical protein
MPPGGRWAGKPRQDEPSPGGQPSTPRVGQGGSRGQSREDARRPSALGLGLDVLHAGVKRDPTNFSTPAMRVTLRVGLGLGYGQFTVV